MVKSLLSNAEGAGSTPGQEAKILMPLGQKTKTENRSNIVTHLIRTFQTVHVKKKIFKKIKYTISVKVFFSVYNRGVYP